MSNEQPKTNDEQPTTNYTVNVAFTEPLLRKAAMLFWRHGIGKSGLISLIAIAVSCVVMGLLGVNPWVVGFFSGAGAIGFAIVVVSFFTIRNASLAIFRKMDNKTATFTFTETTIKTESDIGRSEIPWNRIEKVIQYPDFWLFSLSKSSYFTLPIATVPPETKGFILEHCSS